MTSNHLLLYRLAELMLEHEQHILPVDLLFDDEQIGDFVKSIQIDSPYQQMVLEGVLTESVREEKLYVSFTVEGYFHYVLGEVLEIYYQRLGINNLIELVQKKFQKFSELGLSHFLINQINIGNNQIIVKIMELGFQNPNVLTQPIVQILLTQPEFKDIFRYKNKILWASVSKRIIEINKYTLIEKFLSNFDSNYSKELLNNENLPHLTNEYLVSFINELDNNSLKMSLSFYLGRYEDVIEIYERIRADNQVSCGSLFIVASAMIDIGQFETASNLLRLEGLSDEDSIEKLRLESIAFNGLKLNEKAILSVDKSIEKSRELKGAYHNKTAELINLRGLYLLANSEFEKSIIYLKEAGNIFYRLKGEKSFEFATTINNIGLVYYHSGDFVNAIKEWVRAISIFESFGMVNHPETAIIHKNLTYCYYKLEEFTKAKIHIQKSFDILTENGLVESEIAIEYSELLQNIERHDL